MTDFADLKIAVLQTGHAIDEAIAEHGDYDDMCKALLGRAPNEADTYCVLDGDFPRSIDPYDLIVITGSKYGVYEGYDWIAKSEQIIREAFNKDIKLIGICFGHQLIAQALGALVSKHDHGFIAGATDYEICGLSGAPMGLPLYAWHQDQVMTVPQGATIVASSPHCKIAGLRYADKALSLQPHPEFTQAYMSELIEARRGHVVSDRLADDAHASLSTPVDPEPIIEMFRAFATQSASS